MRLMLVMWKTNTGFFFTTAYTKEKKQANIATYCLGISIGESGQQLPYA